MLFVPQVDRRQVIRARIIFGARPRDMMHPTNMTRRFTVLSFSSFRCWLLLDFRKHLYTCEVFEFLAVNGLTAETLHLYPGCWEARTVSPLGFLRRWIVYVGIYVYLCNEETPSLAPQIKTVGSLSFGLLSMKVPDSYLFEVLKSAAVECPESKDFLQSCSYGVHMG